MYDPVFILGLIVSFFWGDEYAVPLAYLDPGTGAMLISAVVGLFATAILAIKTFWYKLKSLFRKKTTKNDSSQGNAG